MAKIFRSNSAKPQTPEDVFMTTAQIRKRYKVTDLEIHELERMGYLIHFLLDRKAKRYWRADVEAGVHAFCNDLPAPSPNYKHHDSTNWEV